MNHSLVNPGGITDTNAQFPNIDFSGSGVAATTLFFPVDLGPDMAAIIEPVSSGEGVTSASAYHDMRIKSPVDNHVNGVGNTAGGLAVGMDGLRIGRGAVMRDLIVNSVAAGISGHRRPLGNAHRLLEQQQLRRALPPV